MPDNNKMYDLSEVKDMIKDNLGTPKNNANAARTLAGIKFFCTNGSLEVNAELLPELSPKGKLQAELSCAYEGCINTHVREQSDWHQSMFCRTHAKKSKLTDEEKKERKIARLQKELDQLTDLPSYLG